MPVIADSLNIAKTPSELAFCRDSAKSDLILYGEANVSGISCEEFSVVSE